MVDVEQAARAAAEEINKYADLPNEDVALHPDFLTEIIARHFAPLAAELDQWRQKAESTFRQLLATVTERDALANERDRLLRLLTTEFVRQNPGLPVPDWDTITKAQAAAAAESEE